MVNSQHIHTFLSSYIQYSKEDIATLENMAEKEPFFSIVNVALLKAYHQNNEKEKYEKLLPKVALMVPDRSVLKKHIEGIIIKEILKEEIKTIEIPADRKTEILEETLQEETEESVEEDIQDILPIPDILEENEAEEPESFIEEKTEEISLVLEEKGPEEAEGLIEERTEEVPETFMETRMEETPETSEEYKEEEPLNMTEEEIEETPIILEENKEEESENLTEIQEFSEENEVEEPKNISEENHTEELVEEDNFFAWLQHIKEDEPVKDEAVIAETDKNAEEDTEPEVEEKMMSAEEENPEEDEIIDEKRSQSEIDELLNKFIATNPSISRPKMNFYNPVDKAKESEEIKGDMASETLAKIYVSQQLYDKAVLVWEQLKKTNPEKNDSYQKEIESVKKLKKGK